jgi:hypothetical protein
MKQTFAAAALAALIWAGALTDAGADTRTIPRPLPSHQGNIFLAGETITIPAPPAADGEAWRAVDYEGRTVAEGRVTDGSIPLGHLPVGYYEVWRSSASATNRLSLGVLEGLRAPTPLSSPIGIDVAMAWCVPKENWGSAANLCALAGMNRVRDRLSWPALEPAKGQFAPANSYDYSVKTQSAAGLQLLDVGHNSPAWANPNGKRFPLDLRDTYNFHRALAQRWQREVVAFEPWNEADIPMFGGHTGSEMASLQKAAYLGLKAGNPKVIACLNVFALHRAATLRDLQENAAWPYFDTFNLHHYEPLNAYPKLYADFRAVSAGKPLWVTECSVPVKWHGDEQLQEPTDEDLRVQGERLVMTYAEALHEGAQAVFYFMLPHYVEHQTQFGIVHRDLTPRPAFVVLAAVGRLLADAKPLGQLKTGSNSVRAFLFGAKPDGQRAEVLVAWSETETTLELPKRPTACFDHLGRIRDVSGKALKLSRAPLFVVLAAGTRLPLVPPPEPAKLLPGKPSPLVLQAVLPEETIVLGKSAYKTPAAQTTTIPIFLYNFGEKPARGRLNASLRFDTAKPLVPNPWRVELPGEAEVLPGERKELALRVTCATTNSPDAAAIRITGEFGRAGKPVLSLNLLPGAN